MAKFNYYKCTTDELIALGKEVGIELTGDLGTPAQRKDFVDKIRAAKGEMVEPKNEFDKKDFVVVVFHNKDEQDLPFVFLGLNGKSWYIPKEKEVLIPKALLNVVNDAVEVKLVQKKASDGKPYYEERQVHRFPYQLVTR